MSESPETASNSDDTRSVAVEIDEDLMARAERVYPASPNNTELVRRLVERGVLTRERELAERE